MSTSVPPSDPANAPGAVPDPLFTSRLDPAVVGAIEEFARHERILVALDFDGTLAPIVLRAAEARMTPAAADAILALSRAPGIHLAVVSGRDAEDLSRVAWLPEGTSVVGSHGAQMGAVRTVEGPEGPVQRLESHDTRLDAEAATLLTEVARRLQVIADHHEGAHVEHKPTTAVLHTRACSERDSEIATAEAVAGPGALTGVRAIVGKEVVELSVLDVTKGDALTLLREHTGVDAVMYVGDDTTDEDAFAVLSPPDLSVKVGDGDTRAGYRVAGPHEVPVVLNELLHRRG